MDQMTATASSSVKKTAKKLAAEKLLLQIGFKPQKVRTVVVVAVVIVINNKRSELNTFLANVHLLTGCASKPVYE